ncbi:MerR family transcriptional regulator [Arcanobacterium haemolyticum]|nr:MerR family transcriptional regulator [Arcanobacterium haemolyticum]
MTNYSLVSQVETGQPDAKVAWPQDLSHEPNLKIGDVTAALATEFPMLSQSKIRHYESLELITPHRTASNQRLFSVADVERLRFILQEQRDRYLPLSQIREMLRQLDSGDLPEGAHPGRMRAVADDEVRRAQPGTRLRVEEVSELTGVSVTDITAMVDIGILATDPRGRLSCQAPEIVRYASMMQANGYELRQIKSIRTSAHSHAIMITSALATERAKKTAVAKERVITQAAEDAAAMTHLYRALLAENVEVELR